MDGDPAWGLHWRPTIDFVKPILLQVPLLVWWLGPWLGMAYAVDAQLHGPHRIASYLVSPCCACAILSDPCAEVRQRVGLGAKREGGIVMCSSLWPPFAGIPNSSSRIYGVAAQQEEPCSSYLPSMPV